MTCGEIMKKSVIRADENDSVQIAAGYMRDANIGFLPVCDEAGRVVGTLTDRDIAIRVDAEGKTAAACRVGDIMTRESISCAATDDLGRAESLMAEFQKSRMLVTDEDGVLEGRAEPLGHRSGRRA
jgi:CBS domain-containing protein